MIKPTFVHLSSRLKVVWTSYYWQCNCCGESGTSKSVRKWMASGSVTSLFLFSTSFFSLPHLKTTNNHNLNMWLQNMFVETGWSSNEVPLLNHSAFKVNIHIPDIINNKSRNKKYLSYVRLVAQHPLMIMSVGFLPAESLWDKFQVVVSSHELGKAWEFANARWNPVKVQFVWVHVQFLKFGQLTDCRLDTDTQAKVRFYGKHRKCAQITRTS